MVPVRILVNNPYMETHPKPGKSYAIEKIPLRDSLPAKNVNLSEIFIVSQVLDAIMLKRSQVSIINLGKKFSNA